MRALQSRRRLGEFMMEGLQSLRQYLYDKIPYELTTESSNQTLRDRNVSDPAKIAAVYQKIMEVSMILSFSPSWIQVVAQNELDRYGATIGSKYLEKMTRLTMTDIFDTILAEGMPFLYYLNLRSYDQFDIQLTAPKKRTLLTTILEQDNEITDYFSQYVEKSMLYYKQALDEMSKL